MAQNMVDKSDLVARFGSEADIPHRLTVALDTIHAHLKQQPDKFISLKATANFDKDVDSSLFHEMDVYKGLVVALQGDYKLTNVDKMWLHPDIYKCRAMFEGGDAAKTAAIGDDSIGSMNCSAGVYAIRYQNEIGDICENKSTIVDSYLPMSSRMNNIEGKTVANLFSNKLRTETINHVSQVAKQLGAGKRGATFWVNNLMRGADNELYYFNGNIRGSEALVLLSPLKGFKMIRSAKDNSVFPADIIDEQNLIPFANLTRENQLSVYDRVKWSSNEIVNTYMLKRPIKNMDFHDAQHYQMVKMVLSHQPITDCLSPQQLYAITPPYENIKESVANNTSSWLREDKVKLDATESNMQALLRKRSMLAVLNADIYDADLDRLTVPREWLKHL